MKFEPEYYPVESGIPFPDAAVELPSSPENTWHDAQKFLVDCVEVVSN